MNHRQQEDGDSLEGVSRFTVRVPRGLLEAVDQKLAGGRQSRSAVVRRLLEDALRDFDEQQAIERYVQGYREQPQTDEEFGWSDRVTEQRLAKVDWR